MVCSSFLRYGSEQAAGLARGGHDVVLYYVDRLDDFGGDALERDEYLRRAEAAGARCVALPRRRLSRIVGDTLWLHRSLRAESIGPLIVHAHVDPRFAFLGWRFDTALFVHDPVVHSGDSESTFSWPLRVIARFSEATAAAVLVHSSTLAGQLNRWIHPASVAVVPHGAAVSSSPIDSPAAPHLVLVGRLMAYKGVNVAIAAAEIVRAVRPDCTLTIAGRGDLSADLGAIQDPAVTIVDRYVSERELDTLLASARIVLLPYLDASQSGVGLLAIARGIPCVVSKTGALPELLPPSHGVQAVPPGDVDALAAAILATLDHGDEHRRQTLAHATANFSWERVGERALGEIRRILAL